MKIRKSDYSVTPLILNRWSPRALSGASIDKKDLMTLFDAARWAPSSYNNQSWRFIFATRDMPEWNLLFNLMVEPNQVWAKNAAALVVIFSKNTFDFNNKPSRTHSFDTGAAWQNLSLQATAMNLVVHGMEGFDYDRAKKDLGIPDDYTIEAMCAIGKLGKKEELPEKLQQVEEPSDRKPLSEIVFAGKFGKKI
jgi:nitroreductase